MERGNTVGGEDVESGFWRQVFVRWGRMSVGPSSTGRSVSADWKEFGCWLPGARYGTCAKSASISL